LHASRSYSFGSDVSYDGNDYSLLCNGFETL
jgi:hypothetical protein